MIAVRVPTPKELDALKILSDEDWSYYRDNLCPWPDEVANCSRLEAIERLGNLWANAIHQPVYRCEPVHPREFIESDVFLHQKGAIWPAVMEAIEEITSGKYIEAVLTGGIGTAKTTIALYAQAYELYKLGCMESPHDEMGLDPTSEIMVIFQSISASLAKAVDYTRFKAIIDRCQWFQKNFIYDPTITSELRFPNRIVVKPVSGDATGAIGQNVIGGILDEMNFMAIVKDSKKARGENNEFDQAKALYNSIARRRESRFMDKGNMPGMLCLVSSANYPGQFTDQKIAEAHKPGARIFVYNKRLWDVKPDAFGTQRFHVFIGNENRKPRILKDDDTESNPDMVLSVPIEFYHQFENDLLNALRDIGGVATQSMHPFMMNTDKVADSFGKVESILSREDVDFERTQLQLLTGKICNPQAPRYVHIDLAVSSDSAGVAMGHVAGWMNVRRDQAVEILPIIQYDFILQVKPPPSGEIQFENIRRVLYGVREFVDIRWVSFDTYQSKDSMQMLKAQGFRVGTVSLDKTTDGYEVTKQAFYDGRIIAPKHEFVLKELVMLEREPKKGMIDHPPHGSKDCADALAGVCFGLHMQREIWRRAGIPTSKIPEWLTKRAEAKKASNYQQEERGHGTPGEARLQVVR